MRALPWILLALLLAGPLLASATPQHPTFPADERWWESAALDPDRDGVDDALETLLDAAAPSDPLVVLLGYARMPTPAEKAAVRGSGAFIVHEYRHFPILAVRAPAAHVRGLADLPGVALVEKDDVIRRQLKESVPLMGVPQAIQRYGATGQGVVVAVLDDGAFDQHPDLQRKVAAAYDAAGGADATPLGGAITVVAPASDEGHATHVAGTIVGGGDRSGGVYKGVAPDARYVNVKVFTGPNQTSSSVVLNGLDWVLDHREDLDIRIASLSLGGRASDGRDALSRAVNVAVDKGLVVVAAAGNTGPAEGTVSSPGAAAKAITVGAVDKRKGLAHFSARGPTLDGRVKPDVVAPGVGIVSTVPPGRTGGAGILSGDDRTLLYGPLSGTSMAAPHVAGVVALMLEAEPTLDPGDVKRILLATAQDLGKPGVDNETGHGFVNAIAALQVAQDLTLLESPGMRERLASIPDPPPEPFMERLSYEMQALGRSGRLTLYAVLGVVLVAAVAGAWMLRRKKPEP